MKLLFMVLGPGALLCAEAAWSKPKSKRGKQRSSQAEGLTREAVHDHIHDHDHGHAHESKHAHKHRKSAFSLGVSLTFSTGFGAQSEGQESGGHENHNHGLRDSPGLTMLHGGDGHTHDGSEPGTQSSGPASELSLAAGYRLGKRWQLNAGAGLNLSTGLGDPKGGLSYEMALDRRINLLTSFTATMPLSRASQENFKLTTLTLESGPTWKKSRWTVGLKAGISQSLYSKELHSGEESADHDHAHLQLAEEREHENHTDESREQGRYSVGGTVHYRMDKNWRLGTGLTSAYITQENGSASIASQASLVQGSYLWNAFTGTLALAVSTNLDSEGMRTTPGIMAGITHLYE